MINENSIQFVNKFISRVIELNDKNICITKQPFTEVKLDFAVICMTMSKPLSLDDDQVILMITHISKTLDAFCALSTKFDFYSKNSQWTYESLGTIKKISKERLKQCYSRLRENRGDLAVKGGIASGFGSKID